jgi:hypothetical protein
MDTVDMTPPYLNVNEINTSPVFLYVQQCLSDYPALKEHAQFKSVQAQTIEQMVLTLTTWCLAGRVPSRTDDVTVEWPDGVWQMFKHRHMPQWYIDKFPVRMAKKVVATATHHYFVCPHLVSDESRMHVKFMATGNPVAARM